MTTFLNRQMLAKVPAITTFFWIIKVLSTTVGETFADYLNNTLGFGLGNTAAIMSVALVFILIVQFAFRRYVPVVYWLAIVAISTVGTLITDNMHDGLGIENWQSIIIFGAALIVTFVIWYRMERSLEMKSITTTPREAFYWLAILFTFALGTASGDIFADDLGVPLAASLIGFTVALALVFVLWKTKVLGSVTAFWIAYVLTRPLGASLGDLLSQPTSNTGLGLGATNTSLIFLAAIAGLVIYLTVTKRDKLENMK